MHSQVLGIWGYGEVVVQNGAGGSSQSLSPTGMTWAAVIWRGIAKLEAEGKHWLSGKAGRAQSDWESSGGTNQKRSFCKRAGRLPLAQPSRLQEILLGINSSMAPLDFHGSACQGLSICLDEPPFANCSSHCKRTIKMLFHLIHNKYVAG